ncbi:dyslexia-associated protein KIAA0319-like protein [Ctenocephalides felis]|uniref:dyslexia-associated protein KIAA0319-like protein n=1 Tax=Ctenocephalides felis TaxID=7515 RepID=UPI000E6E5887|nr:dyslexia-associated protein KIAA0319-like protein [Ctenocephalides felis]
MVDNNIKSWTINIILIVFFTYISCDNVNNGDILERCPRIYPRVFNGFAPIGNYSAGNFSEYKPSKDIDQCVASCCLADKCHVALQHNTTCYHISCATNQLCLPLYRESQASITKMVLVNTISDDDYTWKKIIAESNLNDNIELVDHYSDDELDNTDHQNRYRNKFKYSYNDEILNPYISKPSDRYFDNLQYTRFDEQYPSDDMIMEGSMLSKVTVKPCEVGIVVDCPRNEDCYPIQPKSRSGICNCINGYVRRDSGVCEIDNDRVSTSNEIKTISTNLQMTNSNNNSIAPNTPSTTSKPELAQKTLKVSVMNKEVRLPENEVTLSAYTIPNVNSDKTYEFTWTLVSQPERGNIGTMTEQTGGTIKLSQLTEGLYRFKVSVKGDGAYGEAFANVTVLPKNRINKAPIVIITPTSQTVKLPNTGAVLDGSTSFDDDGIVRWHWELQQGPLGYQPNLPETPTLQLSDLTLPGNYTFKLTVEDTDHVLNSTTGNITVIKGIDYPPSAIAGEDVIIYLPHNNLTLNGNLSTDDREIVTWQWTKASSDQSKAVDMQDTRTPYLKLSNLEEGMYTFVLKVTDSSDQSSEAEVHVFVKPPSNKPPEANAGNDQSVILPQTWSVLNGTLSKDDDKIVRYEWSQVSGPSNSIILKNNESLANATSLTIGTYIMQLTVTDNSGNKASDTMTVTVLQTQNSRPVANAGGDQSLTLPLNYLILNGSNSHDDLKITNWTWSRDGASLAAGRILEGMNSSILKLTDLVAGRYVFKLKVTDAQGLSSEDAVSVIIHPDPLSLHLVQLTLNADAGMLTESQVKAFEQKLQLLLGVDTSLHIRDLTQELHTGRTILLFYVEKNDTVTRKSSIMPGPAVVAMLKNRFRQDTGLLEISVIQIRTLICQNSCSGHGVCDPDTRTCLCEAFWMEDYFAKYFRGSESNCDWSILYVVLSIFIVTVCVVGGLACLCHKLCLSRPGANKKYKLIGDKDETPNFSRMISQSDSDTESDVLFESRTKNGRLSNGDNSRNGNQKNGFIKMGRRIKT